MDFTWPRDWGGVGSTDLLCLSGTLIHHHGAEVDAECLSPRLGCAKSKRKAHSASLPLLVRSLSGKFAYELFGNSSHESVYYLVSCGVIERAFYTLIRHASRTKVNGLGAAD